LERRPEFDLNQFVLALDPFGIREISPALGDRFQALFNRRGVASAVIFEVRTAPGCIPISFCCLLVVRLLLVPRLRCEWQ
jgi:hypothetical protein